uniref:Uncharacterized protein n=1 Tax=Tanacetum cinerariifolium TaxID=118510 RepID=A0A6L2KAK1_TANCI|nr:hypothetical protein [Tanacetum cinerariifolium]
MELVLEQTQQEHQSDTKVFTMTMEILLEPTSNKLLVERFDTSTGNPVKEILYKLNLPDHGSILMDSKVTPTKHKRMTKPYSSPHFIANSFNAGYLKMEVKAITDRITRSLPSDTVKNLKLNVNSRTSVLSARSYPMEDPQCSSQIHTSINAITIYSKQQSHSLNEKPEGGPSRNDEEIEWLDVEEPLDLVDTKKDDLKLKLEKFETSSNNLAKLIGSQLDVNNKTGLGYGNHVNGCEANDSKSGTGQRETRPVWDNRVNHQNKLTHPHPKRNFVPAAILTNSGQVPVNAARQSSHKAVASVSAARRVNTAAPRPNVNSARPTTTKDLVIIKLIQRVKRLEWELKCTTNDYERFGDYKIDTESQEAGMGVKSKNSIHKNSKGCSKMANQEKLIPSLKKLVWNEAVYEEDIALLKLDVQLRDISIKDLKNQLESALKEKDDLKLKLEKFETSSNNLAKLIGSQLDANNKTGLGYGNHVNRCEANDSKSVSDEEDSPVNDTFKKSNGNYAVPPPYTGNYMPPRADLSFAGLDDSVYKCTVTESISNESKVETNVTKSCTHLIEKSKTDRPSALIIDKWESDSDNDSTISPISDQPKHTPIKINFVEPVECFECGENEKQAEKHTSFTQNPKVDRKDWNELKVQKLDDTTKEVLVTEKEEIELEIAVTTTDDSGTSTIFIPGPITIEEKAKKKNDVKARSMLLMALPNEHLMTFNQHKDAKTLFTAKETRFGGNEATKKIQKTLLKQLYENFSATCIESLDSIFNRLQKLVSQLAVLGIFFSQEDLNLKFLRSLPSEWNTHVVIWRNKSYLETMSLDDLYNNFNIVEQEVRGTTSTNTSSQNMAFVSSPSPNSTNEVPTLFGVSTTSPQVSTSNFGDVTVYAFLANQPNRSQLVHEDLKQIYNDDLEEMDLKWQLALLRCKYHQRERMVNGTNHLRVNHNANTVPKAMLTRTGLKPVNSVRHVNPKRNFQRRAASNNRNFFKKVNTARPNSAVLNAVKANKGKAGHSHKKIEDQGYFDSGCFRHMTENISYLTDFKEFDGGTLDNGEIKLNATVDGHYKTITEASVKRHLKLADVDEGGPECHFTMGDIPVQVRPERLSNFPNEPPIAEDKFTHLENELISTKAIYNKALITLTKRVKKLEKKRKHKRRREVIDSSEEEEASLDHEDSPKQERMIEEIDKDENINLVKSSEQEEAHETAEHRIDFSTASPHTDDDETLAETLLNIKRSTAKDKGKNLL